MISFCYSSNSFCWYMLNWDCKCLVRDLDFCKTATSLGIQECVSLVPGVSKGISVIQASKVGIIFIDDSYIPGNCDLTFLAVTASSMTTALSVTAYITSGSAHPKDVCPKLLFCLSIRLFSKTTADWPDLDVPGRIWPQDLTVQCTGYHSSQVKSLLWVKMLLSCNFILLHI